MYSTTVTSHPKLLKTDANSRPITPAPMMQRLPGRVSRASNPVESSTPGSSVPSTERALGRDPVAIIKLSAVYSSPPTRTVLLPVKTPLPRTRVMPGCDMSVSTSSRSLSTTAHLRSYIFAKSTCTSSPHTLLAASIASASWQKAFVGMHPWLRHVPPTSAFSTMVTVSPWRAAYAAVW